ncbi:hypothetical protein ACS0PU_012581 [Formica fusca]
MRGKEIYRIDLAYKSGYTQSERTTNVNFQTFVGCSFLFALYFTFIVGWFFIHTAHKFSLMYCLMSDRYKRDSNADRRFRCNRYGIHIFQTLTADIHICY